MTTGKTIIHDREERLPEVEAFLEKLGVRTRDSDFDSLRKIVDEALAEGDDAFDAQVPPRWQDRVIEELVEPQSSVLDVGCGRATCWFVWRRTPRRPFRGWSSTRRW